MAPATLRHAAASLALAATLAGLYAAAGPAPEGFVYARAAIGTGELWRLVSGHLVHTDPAHLGWNLTAWVLLSVALAGVPRAHPWLAIGAGLIAVDAWLWWGASEATSYCGFSALLHAPLGALLVGLWCGGRRHTALILGLAVLFKTGLEIATGTALFTAPVWPSLPTAHLAGLLAGVATGVADAPRSRAALSPETGAGSGYRRVG